MKVLMTLLFFAANGHHTLLRMMVTSGQIVGFGGVAIGPEVADAALELFVECTVLAVKLCMPILAAELLGQVGMGILMKAIPQINVFSINIELKVLIGLILLLLLISPFSEFLLQTEMTMLDSLRELLAMTGRRQTARGDRGTNLGRGLKNRKGNTQKTTGRTQEGQYVFKPGRGGCCDADGRNLYAFLLARAMTAQMGEFVAYCLAACGSPAGGTEVSRRLLSRRLGFWPRPCFL